MPARTPLDSNQRRGFFAAWGGFALDGMDSFIYALVMVPALRELLPRAGIPISQTGFYGGALFALFLVGWGLSFLWGPIGDRLGRVRTLTLTILCFSVFTFAGALATSVWQLALFRLLAGIGIGGEWTLGGTFIAEEWPEDRRAMGAGLMQTGYYVGVLLAGLLNATVGVHYGWRAMFAVGGLPALLVIYIRAGVREPRHWTPSTGRPLAMIFSAPLRRRTFLNSVYLLVSIVGLWAGSVYVPASVGVLSAEAGLSVAQGTRIASLATVILAVGTVLGCLVAPLLADRIGRRRALALYFAMMFLAISIGFGRVFYAGASALPRFLVVLFALGVGGGNFAMYALWLPEQYPTACRATAFGFATSVGRFVGAGITFIVGAAVSRQHTIGVPVAWTSVAFLVGLMLLPWGVETTGQRLPP